MLVPGIAMRVLDIASKYRTFRRETGYRFVGEGAEREDAHDEIKEIPPASPSGTGLSTAQRQIELILSDDSVR